MAPQFCLGGNIMSGKTAGGLVLIVAGVVAVTWGINHMNDLHTKLLNALGGHDNNGPLAIGAGIVIGIIGLMLIVWKPKSAA
jgi:drug/metabolite transporter (DMT)-like permease